MRSTPARVCGRRWQPGAAPEAIARELGRPPLILIPPMMLDADVYDIAPSTSAVGILHRDGVDPWVVDFGAPEREEGGLERSLNDHVLAIDEAIDRVRRETGREDALGDVDAIALAVAYGVSTGDGSGSPARRSPSARLAGSSWPTSSARWQTSATAASPG